MQSLDWNWFFSTLAQSIAAIGGLTGAFIITKVINNQSGYNKNIELYKIKIKKLLQRSNNRNFKLIIEDSRENVFCEIKIELSNLISDLKIEKEKK